MGGKNKQKTGLLLACWLLLALGLVIFYFINREKIHKNFDRVTGKTSTTSVAVESTEKKSDSNKGNGLIDLEYVPGEAETESTTEVIDVNNVEQESSVTKIEVEKQNPQKEETVSKTEDKKAETVKPKDVPKTKAKLCFVFVDSDGKVIRKMTTKEVDKTNAPLTNAIKTLLDGPDSSNKECMTLIPAGTRLLGASVKNGIATLNFSDEFEFNGINADSYRAQLMQVVYTATEFATVESVQFLIEGQRKDYMGSEELQIWIGSPYSRSNF